MCISVDLPEPDGPMMAVNVPAREVDAHAAEGVDRAGSFAEAACELMTADDRAAPAILCRGGCRLDGGLFHARSVPWTLRRGIGAMPRSPRGELPSPARRPRSPGRRARSWRQVIRA